MYQLPPLPYAYDALEPFIDVATMHLHHEKHHATYVTKLNEALGKHPELSNEPLDSLLRNLNQIPEDIRSQVRNHGGGHFNHSFFWNILGSASANRVPEKVEVPTLNDRFGSFEQFKNAFTAAGLGVFGSGWVWLVREKTSGMLSIITTPNQDAPVMNDLVPILGLDVWEHAYYLKYQNRRSDYIAGFWNVVNWDFVGKSLSAA